MVFISLRTLFFTLFLLISSQSSIMAMKANESPADMLHQAIMNNSIEDVKKAIQAGANVTQKESDGRTPLMLAVFLKKPEIVEILLNSAANVDEKLLEKAIQLSDIKTALLIAKKIGADLNATYSGITLLDLAVKTRDIPSALYLIKNGVDFSKIDPSILSNKNIMSLVLDIYRSVNTNQLPDILELIQELINRGYNIHNNDYQTSIWKMTIIGNIPTIFKKDERIETAIKLFVKNGADLNQKIKTGLAEQFITPLFIVITYSTDPSVLSALLNAGANVNLKAYPELFNRNLKGLQTPLSYAVTTGKSDVIKLLINHGGKLTDEIQQEQPILISSKVTKVNEAIQQTIKQELVAAKTASTKEALNKFASEASELIGRLLTQQEAQQKSATPAEIAQVIQNALPAALSTARTIAQDEAKQMLDQVAKKIIENIKNIINK